MAGPALVANTYLEGTYSEVYPDDLAGRSRHAAAVQAVLVSRAAFRATSPPETPGSIHEGGELGYSLSHAYGAAFDNPDLIVACVVGDGEAETGAAGHQLALATSSSTRRATARCCRSCTSTATRSPARRCSRASRTRSSTALLRGYGYAPIFVEGDDPAAMHQRMAGDARRRRSPRSARSRQTRAHSGVSRAPALADDRAAHAQGLDRPEDGRRQADEGTWRSHQVPMGDMRQAGARAAARRLDAELPARGAVRRRAAGCVAETRGARADGRAAHERQPARQRRPAAARPAPAGLPRLRRRRCRSPGAVDGRGDARAWATSCAT